MTIPTARAEMNVAISGITPAINDGAITMITGMNAINGNTIRMRSRTHVPGFLKRPSFVYSNASPITFPKSILHTPFCSETLVTIVKKMSWGRVLHRISAGSSAPR